MRFRKVPRYRYSGWLAQVVRGRVVRVLTFHRFVEEMRMLDVERWRGHDKPSLSIGHG